MAHEVMLQDIKSGNCHNCLIVKKQSVHEVKRYGFLRIFGLSPRVGAVVGSSL